MIRLQHGWCGLLFGLLTTCLCMGQQLNQRMTNQDVIDMVALGLSDGVIIDKIHAVDSTDFDTSLKGLRALKAGRVSDLVIRAMINPHPAIGAGNNVPLGKPDGNEEAGVDPGPPGPGHITQLSQAEAKTLLVKSVSPTYPPLARTARVQGDVVLDVTIGANGLVEKAETVKGNPLLIPAAIDAVSQWVFLPYLVVGKPAEIETQIAVHFKLGGEESASLTAPVSSTGSESQATRGGVEECANISSVECREKVASAVQESFSTNFPNMRVRALGRVIVFVEPGLFDNQEDLTTYSQRLVQNKGLEAQLCRFGFQKIRFEPSASATTQAIPGDEVDLRCLGAEKQSEVNTEPPRAEREPTVVPDQKQPQTDTRNNAIPFNDQIDTAVGQNDTRSDQVNDDTSAKSTAYAIEATAAIGNMMKDPTSFKVLQVIALTKQGKDGRTSFRGCVHYVGSNSYGGRLQQWGGTP